MWASLCSPEIWLATRGGYMVKESAMARRKRGDFLSKQPSTPGGTFSRRLLVWIAVAVGVLLALVIGAYLYLLTWLQGNGCRAWIESSVRQAAHARQVMVPEPLQMDGTNLTLPQISISRTRYFDELKINKLHVGLDRSSLFRRILRTRQFSAEELRLVFRAGNSPPSRSAAPAVSAEPTGQSTSTRAASGTPVASSATDDGSTDSIAQHNGFFRDIRLRSFEAIYADTSVNFGERFVALKGYRLIAKPAPAGGKGAWTVNIENGQVVTPFSWLNDSGVKSANLKITGEEVQLTSCHILAAPGSARASGRFTPSTGQWKVRTHINKVALARFLHADWKKKLTGTLKGELVFSGQPGQSWQAGGKLETENAVIEALPVLSDLKIGHSYPYRSVHLEKATCDLSFPYSEPGHNIRDAWLWDNIDIRSKDGELLARGRVITGQDGSLSGTLKIGIPAQYIALLGLGNSPLVQQLFTGQAGESEYLWLRVNLSGTLEDPHEDLSARLETVLPKIISSLPGEAIKKLNGVLGGFLPTPPPVQPTEETKEKPKRGNTGVPPPRRRPAPQPVDAVKDIIQSGIDIFL